MCFFNTNNINTNDNDINCIICYCNDNNDYLKKLKCGHLFHNNCINEWIKIKRECPICKKYIQYQKKNKIKILGYNLSTLLFAFMHYGLLIMIINIID